MNFNEIIDKTKDPFLRGFASGVGLVCGVVCAIDICYAVLIVTRAVDKKIKAKKNSNTEPKVITPSNQNNPGKVTNKPSINTVMEESKREGKPVNVKADGNYISESHLDEDELDTDEEVIKDGDIILEERRLEPIDRDNPQIPSEEDGTIYIIPNEDCGDLLDWDVEELIYYKDGILASNTEIIDPKEWGTRMGHEWLNWIDIQDQVCVRNEILCMDYDIVVDFNTYDEMHSQNPQFDNW